MYEKFPVKTVIKLDNGNSMLSNEVMITVFYHYLPFAVPSHLLYFFTLIFPHLLDIFSASSSASCHIKGRQTIFINVLALIRNTEQHSSCSLMAPDLFDLLFALSRLKAKRKTKKTESNYNAKRCTTKRTTGFRQRKRRHLYFYMPSTSSTTDLLSDGPLYWAVCRRRSNGRKVVCEMSVS